MGNKEIYIVKRDGKARLWGCWANQAAAKVR